MTRPPAIPHLALDEHLFNVLLVTGLHAVKLCTFAVVGAFCLWLISKAFRNFMGR